MKKYTFNEIELQRMKVEKLNQRKSEEILQISREKHKQTEKQIESHDVFLTNLEETLGIGSTKNIKSEKYEEYQQPKNDIKEWDELVCEAEQVCPETIDFTDLLSNEEILNAYRELDEIDEQFKRQTGLKKKDIAFLAIAVALQCARQYVIEPWLKSNRPKANSNDEKGRKGNAKEGWYYVPTQDILTNRVPFDCQGYSDNSTVKNFLKGGNHRVVTLGHDPILGWIFGTANIMTNTMTRVDFQSAHIKYIPGKGNSVHSLADTKRIFLECKTRVFDEGIDGKIALGAALAREGIHLKSDINTKYGLPLPFVSSISTSAANSLAQYGIDVAGVGTGIMLSSVINMIIAMVHRLTYDASVDENLYEVRTRKIILYSNLIASTSNIIVSYVKKDPTCLDVGGLIVTIMRLFSDIKFMARVKQEFIQSKLDYSFNGIADEIDNIYKNYYGVIV